MTVDDITDQPGAVRPGEELPLARLLPWLRDRLSIPDEQPQVRQFSGGASNWTYELRFSSLSLILRRAPAGTKARGAHDMQREYRIQKALRPAFPLVPKMLALGTEPDIIGTDFYVMEKLNGMIPRRNLPRLASFTATDCTLLCQRLLDTLIRLHQVDYHAHGLDKLARGAGYTQRQVEGWSRRYTNARTWNVPSARRVQHWLQHNLPANESLSLIHNDFRFDNVVLDTTQPTRIIGVLDWEMATIGNPLMDLGNTLAYWVQADDDFFRRRTRRQPTHLPGMFTRQQVVDYYRQHTGADFEDFTFYEVYGLFRLAAIVQQIYYRYHRGETRNPAFRHFWLLSAYLVWKCARLIRETKCY